MASRLKSVKQTAAVLVAVAAGLLPLSGSPACADPTADARKAIGTQYNKYCKAQDAKDIKGVMAVFSNDFVERDSSGHKSGYAQYRAQRLKFFASSGPINSHVDIDSISCTNDTAILQIHEGDFVMEKAVSRGGARSISIGDSWRKEKWVKKSGVWLLIASSIGER